VVREEVIAQQVRVELALRRPAEAERIMQAEGFSFSGGFSAPESLPGRTSGALYTAALRILLSLARSGNPKTGLEAGLGLADKLIAEAVRRGLVFYELELHLLRAQLHSVNKNDRSAREDLKAALSLGEPEGYVTIFIEEGAGVGEMLPGMMRENALAGISPEYVAKIQAGISMPPESRTAEAARMIARLTARELEVLKLMAQGLRYEEVAERLVISLNTVRSHVKTIYGKLGVDNRTRAIELAQRMNVL
jgi:LuxR family transcriptional regulator, maltose regulon positive regulatory protein